MGRAFVYVILGGGVAAGYAALEFVNRGISQGELCIISDEPVVPYERPALSKGFLLPEAPARLPSFHTCIGANEERLTPKWYKEHGIELILGTAVKSADVRRKTLLTTTGETISYKILIVATGARLEEFGVSGSDADNVCYLRNLADATRLVDVMQSSSGGDAIVIGGGYIGMECAASLVINKINVTMVFPEAHCMARLFTPKIANYYEEYYRARGIRFVKGTVLSSFEIDSNGKVTAVNLRDGSRIETDMVVVGIGIRPNTSLFEGQLTMEKGGIKVNGHMQTSNSSVYAVGDVAAFPVKLFGETRRLEHVDSARKSAKHAVTAIMEPEKTADFDYLPFFYSRVFTFSWQFYGDNVGEVIHFGDYSSGHTFGAYWVSKGHLLGSFLEGGTKEDYQLIAKATRLKPVVTDLVELERQGLAFAKEVVANSTPEPSMDQSGSAIASPEEKPLYTKHAAAGVILAASIATFAYWYGRRRRRW